MEGVGTRIESPLHLEVNPCRVHDKNAIHDLFPKDCHYVQQRQHVSKIPNYTPRRPNRARLIELDAVWP